MMATAGNYTITTVPVRMYSYVTSTVQYRTVLEHHNEGGRPSPPASSITSHPKEERMRDDEKMKRATWSVQRMLQSAK